MAATLPPLPPPPSIRVGGGVWSRRWNYKFIVKQSSLDINKGELGKVLTLTTLNQRLARYI